MKPISINELLSLEDYAKVRSSFRGDIMKLKTKRQVLIGKNIRLLFENRSTILYQVQEMLRIERIFEQNAILDELNSYNPLIPNGNNLKATMMIEYSNVSMRKKKLKQLIDIEKMLYLQVANYKKITPIANEDLPRDTTEKTSAVHFLRFQLEKNAVDAFKAGKKVVFGCEHKNYKAKKQISTNLQNVLALDFN